MNAIKLALSALEKAITKTRLHDPKVLQQLMLLKSLLSPYTEGKSMRASDLIEQVLEGNDPVKVIGESEEYYVVYSDHTDMLGKVKWYFVDKGDDSKKLLDKLSSHNRHGDIFKTSVKNPPKEFEGDKKGLIKVLKGSWEGGVGRPLGGKFSRYGRYGG